MPQAFCRGRVPRNRPEAGAPFTRRRSARQAKRVSVQGVLYGVW